MSAWLDAAAAHRPASPALDHAGVRWSYADLAGRAARLATALRELGVGAGDRVIVRRGPSAEAIALLHAIWRLGACAAPLNLRLTARETSQQIARLRPKLVLDEAAALETASEPTAASAVDPEALAVLLFTSGTSGTPKAAGLRFRNLEASALASRARLRTGEDDVWLACLPLFHVGGLSILVRAALDGARVVLHERFDVERVSAAIDGDGVTLVSLVPTTLKRLLDRRRDRPPPPSLRSVLLGGAQAPPALLERALRAGFPVRPSYGLTECASQVATAAPGTVDGRVGEALPGIEVRVVDAAGRACPNGAEGEIQVRGSVVFAGYWDDPAATARAFDGLWLRTGDAGTLDEGGRLRVLDRRSDLIVSGGENVYPAEVEAVLLAHPTVGEAAVWRREDPDLGHRVVAWVVPVGAGVDAVALRAHCRERLAGYKTPHEIEIVEALPRNAMGKVVRSALGASRSA